MRVKAFTLRCGDNGEFDDDELVQFCAHNEVLQVYEHMLDRPAGPAWGVLLTYRERRRPGPRPPQPERQAAAEIPEADRALFEALRRWRNDRAVRDGKPAYILFRNRQLADIARSRPDSVSELMKIHGVGEAKCRDYGEELLQVVRQATSDG